MVHLTGTGCKCQTYNLDIFRVGPSLTPALQSLASSSCQVHDLQLLFLKLLSFAARPEFQKDHVLFPFLQINGCVFETRLP